jgi:hypothetical protein
MCSAYPDSVIQDYVLFTNTMWSQAPRLRHQVARLIAGAGHRVTFFERPLHAATRVDRAPREVEPRIRVVSTSELLHHQLRLVEPLQSMNAAFVSRQIAASLPADVDRDRCTIVNFRYDYAFLRQAFPANRLLTIIHDDFEAQCRFPVRTHITRALAATCRASDAVFVVSTPLQRRLSAWCQPQLFLPWSVVPYRAPNPAMSARQDLLFWGYVDTAVDLELVCRLAATLRESGGGRVLLVGPTEKSHRRVRIQQRLRTESNVEVRDRTDLDDLPLDTLLGAILPYVRSESVNAVTLANKSMQLLARGLPLMISAMPDFVKMPFVLRLDGEEPLDRVLQACRQGFGGWQDSIREFVEANSPKTRLKALGIPVDTTPDV